MPDTREQDVTEFYQEPSLVKKWKCEDCLKIYLQDKKSFSALIDYIDEYGSKGVADDSRRDRFIPSTIKDSMKIDNIYEIATIDSLNAYFKNDDYMFTLTSPSKEFLIKILSTFRFLE